MCLVVLSLWLSLPASPSSLGGQERRLVRLVVEGAEAVGELLLEVFKLDDRWGEGLRKPSRGR